MTSLKSYAMQAAVDIVASQPLLGLTTWTTKDGRVLDVASMEPRHRTNVIRMLLPQIEKWLDLYSLQVAMYATDTAENAADFLENYADALIGVDPAQVLAATPLGQALYANLLKSRIEN